MGKSKKKKGGEKETCNFLVANIGKPPFADIKDHVETCDDCKSFLGLLWQDYKSLSSVSQKSMLSVFGITDMPPGLNGIGEYLERWHMKKAVMIDKGDFFNEAIRKKYFSEDGLFYISFVLTAQSTSMLLLKRFARDASVPKELLEEQLKILSNAWRDFQNFFGKTETNYFLGLKSSAEFEEIMEGWKIALTESPPKH